MLIVIDMQVDFFECVPALAAQRGSLVAAINALVAEFRRACLPVVWVRQEFAVDLSDAFLDMRRHNTAITIAGTTGCQILPDLDQHAGDEVIVKKRYSAFFGTGLEGLLAPLAPTTIVLAGINTHACIRTTAIDAYQRDYEVILAGECVGSGDRAHHDMTLNYLDDHIVRIWSNADLAARLRDV
ncbi:MAG: cysteine hydrolase [Gemmatimonadales bacterium]|nr:cysteine hydrolase [Gemmatimonadales bacterium]